MLFKLIVKEYNKPVVSEVDQIINAITEKKPIKYISNGIELKSNHTVHYFNILDMEKGISYDKEMILKQVFKQYSFYNEDVRAGYKTRCNTKDIQLAEDYILDYYNYVVHLN
jgi:arginine decarboxylase-like protein